MSDKSTEIFPETLHPDLYIWIAVNMSEFDRKRCAAALENVGYGMLDAANLFALARDLHSDGESASPGFRSLLNVCAAHFGAMAEDQVDLVFTMGQKLHHERHQAEQYRSGPKPTDPPPDERS
jgi:hypothetical protein